MAPGHDVTLVATVAGNGRRFACPAWRDRPVSIATGERAVSGDVLGGQSTTGATQIGPLGTASFVTSSLASGHHLITAHYGGDPNFTPSDSNTVDVLVGNVDGPTVVDVSRFGYHMHPTTLVVTFSASLDPARARISPTTIWSRVDPTASSERVMTC